MHVLEIFLVPAAYALTINVYICNALISNIFIFILEIPENKKQKGNENVLITRLCY